MQVGVAPEQRALVAVNRLLHNKGPRPDSTWDAVAAAWRDEQLTPLELADLISTGAGWTGCHLGGRSHREDHVLASNLIALDIDGDIRLEDFWAIPAVSRHCLFTATSCSHTDQEHRFRALFLSDAISDTKLHGAIYDRWLTRLGIELKDNCGRKPERLWYGNSAAVLQFGGGEPIPWDLIEDAKADLKAKAAAKAAMAPRPSSDNDQALDNRRAAWVLLHLLEPSSKGQYLPYWQVVMNAAAATGDDAVKDAFLNWHQRGYHRNNQTGVAKRLERAGTKMSPGEGAGCILSFAKKQHGELWWQRLPEELRYGRGRGAGSVVTPTTLLRSRNASSIQPDRPAGGPSSLSPSPATGATGTGATGTGATAPDLVPSAAELQRLARDAQPAALFSSSRLGATDAAAEPAPISENAHIEQLLCRLYYLETERIDLTEAGEQTLSPRATRYRIDQIESELLAYQVFRSNPQRIRSRLLQIFCDINGIVERDSSELTCAPPLLDDDIDNSPLIEGLMANAASYLLYSLPAAGKTTLALMLARAVLGAPGASDFLGYKVIPPRPFSESRVIYIGSDGNLFARGDINSYLRKTKQADKEWVNYLQLLSARRNDKAAPWRFDLQGFHKLVSCLDDFEAQGTPVTMVIIDSLKACMPEGMYVGDQGVTRILKIMEEICERRNATLVYLHHQSKENDQPQGVAGLTEMVHGYFRLKREDNQHTFYVMKTREGSGQQREIPYKIDNQGALVVSGEPGAGGAETPHSLLLAVFADHYAKHLKLVDHLQEGDPDRHYRGIQRSDLPLYLRARGDGAAELLPQRSLDRYIKDLLKDGRLKKIEHGRYGIAHSRQIDPQRELDLPLEDDLPGWDDGF